MNEPTDFSKLYIIKVPPRCVVTSAVEAVRKRFNLREDQAVSLLLQRASMNFLNDPINEKFISDLTIARKYVEKYLQE